MLLLREEDARQVLTMEMCIQTVESAYASMGRGEATNAPRHNLWIANPKSIKVAAAGPVLGRYMGVTSYTGGYGGKKGSGPYTTLLYDAKEGSLLSVVESSLISWYRTGASSAVATRALARKDAKNLAIIGTGRQAVTQLQAITNVMNAERISVYSRTPEGRQAFASKMSATTGGHITPAADAQTCLSTADVVVTITTSKVPVLRREWLRDGVHINAIGAHYPSASEIDADTVLSSRVIVDSREQALLEKGEILIPLANGDARVERLVAGELGEVLAGVVAGRTSDDENTLFCSGGLAAEQVAVASGVYEEARRRGLGKEL